MNPVLCKHPQIAEWATLTRKIAEALPQGRRLESAYVAVLDYIWQNGWADAGHDTAAVLFILLEELGYHPRLCIGEVRTGQGRHFDHSWVELDGLVFDAAISRQAGADEASGPVFAGIDLAGRAGTSSLYGYDNGRELGAEAAGVLGKTLADWATQQANIDIWILAAALGELIGLKVSAAQLAGRYGQVTRARQVRKVLRITDRVARARGVGHCPDARPLAGEGGLG